LKNAARGRNKEVFYRDYLAAICRFFEDEMLALIAGPDIHLLIDAKSKIFDSSLVQELALNIICGRFGCHHPPRGCCSGSNDRCSGTPIRCEIRNIPNRGRCFVIEHGLWQQNRSGPIKPLAPHLLLKEYRFSEIYRNTEAESLYHLIRSRSRQRRPPYSWPLLARAIEQVFPQNVWRWLSEQEWRKHAEVGNSPLDGVDTATFDGELHDVFVRSYVLMVDPDPAVVPGPEVIAVIHRIIQEIERRVRQHPDIRDGIECILTPPSPLKNYRVFRFRFASAAAMMAEMVEKAVLSPLRRRCGGWHHISLRILRKSSLPAYGLCGYVPPNQPVRHELDTVSQSDPISRMVRELLVSKTQCKIKLLVLMGCHSFHLAKVFLPFVPNIVCVHPHSAIADRDCIIFSRFFYRILAKHKNVDKLDRIVWKAFYDAIQRVIERAALDGPDGNRPECVSRQRDYALLTQLRIVRVDRSKSDELEQFVRCKLRVPSLSGLSRGRSCSRSVASRSAEVIEMSSCTETADPDSECECPMDVDSEYFSDEMSWQWHRSRSPEFSFATVQCSSPEKGDEVKRVLLERKREEMEEYSHRGAGQRRFNLGWDVTECCCCDDVPHRVEDKFVLLIDGELVHGRDISLPMLQKVGSLRLTRSLGDSPEHSSSRNFVASVAPVLRPDDSPENALDIGTTNFSASSDSEDSEQVIGEPVECERLVSLKLLD